MRNRYFVAYDIMDSQRLTRTYKTMLGWGDRVQYSVFVCNLSPSELIFMQNDLDNIVNLKEDRIVIINTGSAEIPMSRNVITMGTQINMKEDSILVI